MDSKYTEGRYWKVMNISGKGKGVLARKDIKQGELIVADTPLFIVPPDAHSQNKNTLDNYLDCAVKNLNPLDRETFWNLADSKSIQGKTPRGIYFTNCYSIGQGSSTRFPTAMLPILSRINHSCRPNSEFHWNPEQGYEELRASRCILEGEEITDCYLDLTAQGRITQQERRSLLKSGYGFDCNCEVCSLSFNLLEKDDKLRVEAFNLSQTCFDLKNSFSSEQMVEVLRKAERWFFLRKSLGYKLTHQLEAAEVVWHLAMLLGEDEIASNICREGNLLADIRFGADSQEVQIWREKESNPVKYLLG
ncbi:SET domain-containing protein 5 [Eurytemora carolleeae]|uniref:SET domain-containing protein 5 n=1 Tax=Eurytemora carolleeae TaxID=1294199 RepID=UPI000C78E164|nr:SET domain-containing protein 5 [Eurytemora carolleeae]|eukprot:XP_023330711.1 SET domain-containing protein 5-like [Eurytemora affinis]